MRPNNKCVCVGCHCQKLMWRLLLVKANSHRHAIHNTKIWSVSHLLWQCELDSRQLETVADRKSEVWTRSEQLSNSHRHTRHDTDWTFVMSARWCELGITHQPAVCLMLLLTHQPAVCLMLLLTCQPAVCLMLLLTYQPAVCLMLLLTYQPAVCLMLLLTYQPAVCLVVCRWEGGWFAVDNSAVRPQHQPPHGDSVQSRRSAAALWPAAGCVWLSAGHSAAVPSQPLSVATPCRVLHHGSSLGMSVRLSVTCH